MFGPGGALYFTDPPFGLVGQDKDPAKELDFNGVYRFANGQVTVLVRDLGELSPRTFCTFSREFSSFRRHGIAAGQRP